MGDFNKEEFPPLLAAGFHRMTLSEIRQRCVAAFPLSTRREMVMVGLEAVLRRLTEAWVVGEVWVDGSFMTEKINPDDVDILLRVGSGVLEEGLPEQRDAIWWIISNLKELHYCDSYVAFEHPRDHPLHAETEWYRAWYLRQFGFTRDNDPKGIAIVSLPGGLV